MKTWQDVMTGTVSDLVLSHVTFIPNTIEQLVLLFDDYKFSCFQVKDTFEFHLENVKDENCKANTVINRSFSGRSITRKNFMILIKKLKLEYLLSDEGVELYNWLENIEEL